MDETQYSRYLVFFYQDYYPHGGLSDIIGSFTTLDDAIKLVTVQMKDYSRDHAYIFDCVQMMRVWDDNDS